MFLMQRWKSSQGMNFSLKLSFYILYTAICVTTHVDQRVPHYECLPGETVWKCAPYLNIIASMTAVFLLTCSLLVFVLFCMTFQKDNLIAQFIDPCLSNNMWHRQALCLISKVRSLLTLWLPTVAGAGHQDLFPGEEHQRLRGWGPDVKDQRPAAPWWQAGRAQAGGGLQEPF